MKDSARTATLLSLFHRSRTLWRKKVTLEFEFINQPVAFTLFIFNLALSPAVKRRLKLLRDESTALHVDRQESKRREIAKLAEIAAKRRDAIGKMPDYISPPARKAEEQFNDNEDILIDGTDGGWVRKEARGFPGRFYYYSVTTGKSQWDRPNSTLSHLKEDPPSPIAPTVRPSSAVNILQEPVDKAFASNKRGDNDDALERLAKLKDLSVKQASAVVFILFSF